MAATTPVPSKTDREKLKSRLKIVAIIVVSVLLVGVLGFIWKVKHTENQISNSLPKPVVADATTASSSSSSAAPSDFTKSLNTNGANILVLGTSDDVAGHGGANLTDSMMVIHVDKSAKKVVMVSIPRDLWVMYKDPTKWTKINAYLPEYGMNPLATKVSEITGLKVSDTVILNWTSLSKMVDAVGGIDVVIKASDKRGINDPNAHLTITNGAHHIDGKTALALCRARNDPPSGGNTGTPYGLINGDFDRQKNQRMVVQALLKKAQSGSTLTNPVAIYKILSVLGTNVKTSMSSSEMVDLASFVKNTSTTDSVALTDDNGLVKKYITSDGQWSLIPTAGKQDYSKIRAAVAKAIS